MSLRKQLELLYAASCPNDMPDDCGIVGDCAKCQTDQVMEFIRAYINGIMNQWDSKHWSIRHELLEGLE